MITSAEARYGEKDALLLVLWKQRLFGKQSGSGFKRRYHLNKQSYFWDIYPREIKILLRTYTYKVVSCSTQFYLRERRNIGVEQNKCYQREVVEKLWNNHTNGKLCEYQK